MLECYNALFMNFLKSTEPEQRAEIINSPGNDKASTPLHCAAQNSDVVLKTLLHHGGDVRTLDGIGTWCLLCYIYVIFLIF